MLSPSYITASPPIQFQAVRLYTWIAIEHQKPGQTFTKQMVFDQINGVVLKIISDKIRFIMPTINVYRFRSIRTQPEIPNNRPLTLCRFLFGEGTQIDAKRVNVECGVRKQNPFAICWIKSGHFFFSFLILIQVKFNLGVRFRRYLPRFGNVIQLKRPSNHWLNT